MNAGPHIIISCLRGNYTEMISILKDRDNLFQNILDSFSVLGYVFS
jgi:hypothetical protein